MGRNFDLLLHLAPLCLLGTGGLGTDLWWRVHPDWHREPWRGKASKKRHCKQSEVKPPPLLPPCLGNANSPGRKAVEVASSVRFCVCLLVFHLFLLLVLCSAALGGAWRINLLSVVAWTSLSYSSHRIIAGSLLLGNINEKKCYTSDFFKPTFLLSRLWCCFLYGCNCILESCIVKE